MFYILIFMMQLLQEDMLYSLGCQMTAGAKPLDRPRARPVSYSTGTGIVFPGVKWLLREADHLPTSTVKVKNGWSYTSTPPRKFMVRTGTNSHFFCTYTDLCIHSLITVQRLDP
jgi:hypothetical protein